LERDRERNDQAAHQRMQSFHRSPRARLIRSLATIHGSASKHSL
jgi:hypothetical protein